MIWDLVNGGSFGFPGEPYLVGEESAALDVTKSEGEETADNEC